MHNNLTWENLLKEEKSKPYFINIINYIKQRRTEGINIYPLKNEIFNALHFTKLNEIKVVILGQDPYHGINQAHGLAFSVKRGVKIPPSLKNIYKELKNDIPDFQYPGHGCLESWATQGVLLLNIILTVEESKAQSHANIGWEKFTDKIISIINQYCYGVVFLLWGRLAYKKKILINNQRHFILHASHPSPLSAYHNFFGCKHFSKTNYLLNKINKKSINWLL